MSAIFGTDGVRGTFGEPPIDRSTMQQLATALAERLLRSRDTPHVVIGGDTRASTPELWSWLVGPLVERSVTVSHAGVVPTPAIALLVRRLGADAGLAVSASHNPHTDNGVKLFDRDGFKWSVEAENELQTLMDVAPTSAASPAQPGPADAELAGIYADNLVGSLARRALGGMRVALDTANGAASAIARGVFERAGASVEIIGNLPDGRNINVGCGSTDTEALSHHVRTSGASVGFAFDGDADRCLVVDEQGRLLDGDAALYLWARELAKRGMLKPREIVVTSMSNLGLETSLAAEDIGVARCGVGDRQVVTEMRRRGAVLGGEPSGHLIHLGLGTTGDGVLTALQIAAIVATDPAPISARVADLVLFPQVLHNVGVTERTPFTDIAGLDGLLADFRGKLGDEGRIVVRYSGTEPLARIMIEGRDAATIQSMAAELAACLESDVGADAPRLG